MSEPRTQAEILRAAELFKRAFESEAARNDRGMLPKVVVAEKNYELLCWAAGQNNSVVELLAMMERIASRDSLRSPSSGRKAAE